MIYGTVREVVSQKKKGQFANMIYEKQLKTQKKINGRVVTERVEKHTEMMVRFAIEYDHIGKVQDKRDLGILPSVNQGLPWGTWVEEENGKPSNFIEHKGNKYLRAYPVANNIPKTTFYVDGIESTKEKAQKLCLASEFKPSDGKPIDCITIGIDKIIAIR